MENYLKDGRCSISNNAAERAVKSYVMGRKNFLFHDTVKGARASAVVYTLAETAKSKWTKYSSLSGNSNDQDAGLQK